MPLKRYGVLKGRAVDHMPGVGDSPHYQIRVQDDKKTDFRISINVKSKLEPSELLYLVDENFQHSILNELPSLPSKFTPIESEAEGLAVDFIRGNFVDRDKMLALPYNLPGPDNDLNEKIGMIVKRAVDDDQATVYAFGERWPTEANKEDKYFKFLPGNGLHDIHMNQGNVGRFTRDDGVWQDGALMFHFPNRKAPWVALFLAFQSQSWHTDDTTGHRLVDDKEEPVQPIVGDGAVRIVAALVNPEGPSPEHETVTIINTSPHELSLNGWKIVDKNKHKQEIGGSIAAGATRVVELSQKVQLGNKGGIITLLDKEGLKIHGVQYSKKEGKREGWTIVF